jgi:hypothetical protein
VLVGRAIAAASRLGRSGERKGLFLEAEGGVQVNAMGRGDMFVAEPQSDGGDVDAVRIYW